MAGPGHDGPSSDRLGAFMYVYDTTLVDSVETNTAALHLTTAATVAHLEGMELERDFWELNKRAEDLNMKINEKKTQLLVIGPPTGHHYTGSMVGPGGDSIECVEKMKLVGFTFGTKPGVEAHVDAIEERFRRKVWLLYHLRGSGFRGMQLYRLYCCYIRVIMEYCSVVYHPMLTRGQEDALEGLHRLAVKICFGFDIPADVSMEAHAIESLKDRRTRRCDVFLRKAIKNPRFGPAWFPERRGERRGERRDLRRRREIQESRSITWRRFNSPMEYLRRRANELGLGAPEVNH